MSDWPLIDKPLNIIRTKENKLSNRSEREREGRREGEGKGGREGDDRSYFPLGFIPTLRYRLLLFSLLMMTWL